MHFANHAVDFGQYEAFQFRLFARRDAWYLEVHTARGRSADATSRTGERVTDIFTS